MQKLILETTAPFQGLPELVAHDEGLFEQEGCWSTGPTAIRVSRHCQDEIHGAVFTIEHSRAVAMRQ